MTDQAAGSPASRHGTRSAVQVRIDAIRKRFANADAFIENYGDRQESELFRDAKLLLGEVDRLRSGSVALLRELAENIELGREFQRGEWVEVAPLEGVGRLPWTRKAWIEGVEISREVIARQLSDMADWYWTPDENNGGSDASD